jgi:hypothetical protein
VDTGLPGSIVVQQEQGAPGTPSDLEAYLPQTAWTSARKRRDDTGGDSSSE